jgi:predicted  nucleic acid-binding Zn-ribbon protein
MPHNAYGPSTGGEEMADALAAAIKERDDTRRMLNEHNAALRTVTEERDIARRDVENLNTRCVELERQIEAWRVAQAEWVERAATLLRKR